MRSLAHVLGALVVGGALLVAGAAWGAKPLSKVHAHLDKKSECNSCHTAFEGVPQSNCLNCHKDMVKHNNIKRCYGFASRPLHLDMDRQPKKCLSKNTHNTLYISSN